ncbi:MAG: SagB/ThcOx family dehydrogenase [Methanomicrobiaceae archaeon]|nr:SagB/ThcOx family dehydrogenase [Methanomicrobiaceae archaeon]
MAAIALLAIALAAACVGDRLQEEIQVRDAMVHELPGPARESGAAVEEALFGRRSVRNFSERSLTLQELGQLLWACQGITDPRGYRTAPSAGALYPLEVYAVASSVDGLHPGVYRYVPEGHELHRIIDGDVSSALYIAALSQTAVGDAPASIVICAVPDRTTAKYGDRGVHYVYMEAGHAAQNIYLQAFSLDLGTVSIAAFDDARVQQILNLSPGEVPLYIMPVGGV